MHPGHRQNQCIISYGLPCCPYGFGVAPRVRCASALPMGVKRQLVIRAGRGHGCGRKRNESSQPPHFVSSVLTVQKSPAHYYIHSTGNYYAKHTTPRNIQLNEPRIIGISPVVPVRVPPTEENDSTNVANTHHAHPAIGHSTVHVHTYSAHTQTIVQF